MPLSPLSGAGGSILPGGLEFSCGFLEFMNGPALFSVSGGPFSVHGLGFSLGGCRFSLRDGHFPVSRPWFSSLVLSTSGIGFENPEPLGERFPRTGFSPRFREF